MINYTICQIAGKQYKLIPGQPIEVSLHDGQVDAKILVMVEDGKIKIGKPFLDLGLNLKVLEDKLGGKTRIAKYHPKANYRRVKGARSKLTRIVLESVKTLKS